MTTSYGKELRRIRIARNLFLKNMAASLGITSAYLSSIENGKRSIPIKMTNRIVELYHLTNDEVISLKKAEDETRDCIEFKFLDVNDSRKDVVLSLARSFEDITENQIEEIKKILDKAGV